MGQITYMMCGDMLSCVLIVLQLSVMYVVCTFMQ